jgi:hypothetical protein
MPDVELNVGPLLQEILTVGNTVNILDDQENIKQFLVKEINGDSLTNHLVIAATLAKDKQGLLVYLLTTAKIVKIEIDNEKVQSSSAYLKDVTGVNRTSFKNVNDNRSQISIEFPQGRFGLLYPLNDTKIDSFFQKVDEAVRAAKVGS